MKKGLLLFALLTITLSGQSQPAYRVAYFTYYSGEGLSAQGISELPTNLFTHIIYFYTPYGDLAPMYAPGQDEAQWVRLRDWAHSHGAKVLMCYNTTDLTVLSPANLANTVHLVMNFIWGKGYDGIDIDIETSWSQSLMVGFVQALRDSFTARGGAHKFISSYATFGNATEQTTWAACQASMDWVNVSAYDIVGSWTEYTSHYSPLFAPIITHQTDGSNIDASLRWWVSRGYPRSKLLVGGTSDAEMYVGGSGLQLYTGGGATGGAALPGQTWTSQPAIYADVRYRDQGRYWETKPWRWDSAAQSTYISIDRAGNTTDTLICFNDGRALARKWQYAVDSSFGGIYLWEGANTFQPWKPQGQERWSILRALANAITGDSLRPDGNFIAVPDTLPAGGGSVTLTWTSTNATSASISPGIGSVPVNGSTVVSVSATTTFTLTLTNTSGSRDHMASVIVSTPAPPPDSSNKALGRPASASSIQQTGLEAINANDGRVDTRWGSSFADNQWWQVDLGSSTSVNCVYTNWENAYPSQFKISVSSDGASFTDMVTRTLPAPGPYQTQFAETATRYVRITGMTRATQYGISLWEVGVYGPTPAGQGHQDITARASAPIALITQPTGRGNPNMEIIRDGYTPPVGSSDTSGQYATYNGGGARSTDWIGYQFPAQHPFSGLTFQEGVHFPDGGWFTSLNVQVRVGGTWTGVQSLQCTPPYAGADGINYETYELSFTPLTGDAIRIAGAPGGSARYISVGELRVFETGSTPLAPQLATPVNGATGIATNCMLTWSASNGATSYRVQVSTAPGFVTTVVDQSNIVPTSYSISGLAGNTTYFWRVNATSVGGTSAYSQAWGFTTASVPSAPVLLSPPDTAANQSVPVPLSWRRSGGATSYHVQVSADSLFNVLIINDSTVVDSTRQASGLSFQARYFWRVQGRNSNGNGSFSPMRRFTTLSGLPGVPLLQSPASGSTNRSTSILLRWHASVGALSYQLQVSTDSLFSMMILNDSTIVDSSRQLQSLAGLTKYFWRVRGKNPAGKGIFSSSWKFTTKRVRKNVTSSGLMTSLVTHPVGHGNPNMEVIRDGVTPPVGSSNPMDQFDTFSGSRKQFDWIGYTFVEPHQFSNLEFQEGIESDSGGWFQALDVQVRVNGAWINAQNLTSDPPYAPNNDVNFDSYELDFDPVVGDGIRIAGMPGGTDTYISVAELRAMDDDTSASQTKGIDGIADFYKLEQNYPNPFNPTTEIRFALPNAGHVSLVVYDVLGRKAAELVNSDHEAGYHSATWSASDQASGVYFARFIVTDALGNVKYSKVNKLVLMK